jgi:VWFA-related protein
MNASYRVGMFLLCMCSLPVFAQQAGSAPVAVQLQPSPAPASDAANHLVLDVVVADKTGKAVKGLEEKDFTVLDNGHPRTILSFQSTSQATGGGEGTAKASSAEPRVKIILLVDEVNTNFSRVSYERDQIKKFLLQNGGALEYPTSMAFFSDAGTELQNTTSRDGNALMAVFDQHETGLRSIRRAQGFYGAVEQFQLSLNTLRSLAMKETQTPGRKIVLWISPGWPLLSGPGIELSAKDQANLFATITTLSNTLRDARMTVYSIDPLGADGAGGINSFYYKEFLKPVKVAKESLPGNVALQVLVVQSGGLALTASNDIEGLIARCVADADVFYTLTLDPARAEKPNEYHAIEVKVPTHGLTVRTRSGYYAQP